MAEYTRKLQDHSEAELKEMPYHVLCALRADAYEAHVKEMPGEPRIFAWAERMEKRFGPKVKVWAHKVPWIVGLLIARYGEDVQQWPKQFSDDDVRRANRWEDPKTNDWPVGSQAIL